MARRLHPPARMQDSVINPATFRDVDVCVCTFRRASVADLLASLAKLETPGWRMRVIVADNDDQPSARETVERAFAAHGLDGRYIHAPARNISVARNACLDAAQAELVAFIDDDETARPDWLAKLIARHEATKASIVFGKVKAIYAADAPAWMPVADMHSTPPPIRNGAIAGGYTCNVLMRRDVIGALRFDPAYGKTGGEDTTFFSQLQRDGVAMAYAADAVVDEPITQARSSLEWLKTRAYRAGQTWGLVELRNGKPKAALAVMSLAKMAFCLVQAGLTFWSPARWRRALVRSQLHAGVLGAAAGKAPLELYGKADA
jgi:succinoglycan biosynthesis protein ExoM